jgi:hypothetical protein
VQENVSVSVSVATEVTEKGVLMGLPVISAVAIRGFPLAPAVAPAKMPSPFGHCRGPRGLNDNTLTLATVVEVLDVFPQPVLEVTLAKTELPATGRLAETTSPQKRRVQPLRLIADFAFSFTNASFTL